MSNTNTVDLNMILRRSSESLINHSTPSLSDLVKQNETRNNIKGRAMSVASITSLSVMRSDNPNYNIGNNNINNINRNKELSHIVLLNNPPLPSKSISPLKSSSSDESLPIWYPGKSASPINNSNADKISFNNTSKKFTYENENEKNVSSKFMRDYLKDRKSNIISDMQDISDQPGMENSRKYSFKTIGVTEDFKNRVFQISQSLPKGVNFTKYHEDYKNAILPQGSSYQVPSSEELLEQEAILAKELFNRQAQIEIKRKALADQVFILNETRKAFETEESLRKDTELLTFRESKMTKSLEERNVQLLIDAENKRMKDSESYQKELFAESERIEKKEEFLEHKRRKSITQYEALKIEFKQVVNESESVELIN